MRSLFLVCCTAIAFAQSNGQIVGAVSDKSGAVMPGVNVKVRSDQTGLEISATSDEAGRFNFPRVPVGNYKIVAAREGFRQFQSETFRLDADQSREITVTMDLGATTESVTVTGAVAQVDTVNATIREVVDEKRISELPLNGRNPLVGPGNYNLDFALFKKFALREHWQLQYRWEMFNSLNHANLGQPRANINVARTGQIDTTSGPRVMQMGLRMVF